MIAPAGLLREPLEHPNGENEEEEEEADDEDEEKNDEEDDEDPTVCDVQSVHQCHALFPFLSYRFLREGNLRAKASRWQAFFASSAASGWL